MRWPGSRTDAAGGWPTVLLLGADCILGRAVLRHLAGVGCAVTPVPGGRPGHRAKEAGGLVTITDESGLREAVAAHDLVCNMMPVAAQPQGRLSHARMRPERRRRSALLAWLATALEARPATGLIQRSTAMLYRDGGSSWVTEAWPVSAAALTIHAADAENAAAAHAARGGTAVVLRLGHLYGPADPWTRTVIALARKGWQPLDWHEDAYFPMLHLDDAARAVAASLRLPGGTYNIADTSPPTIRQLHTVLAALAGQASLHPLYRPIRPADRELLTRSCRLDATALTRETGWHPAAAPTVTGGLGVLFAARSAAPHRSAGDRRERRTASPWPGS